MEKSPVDQKIPSYASCLINPAWTSTRGTSRSRNILRNPEPIKTPSIINNVTRGSIRERRYLQQQQQQPQLPKIPPTTPRIVVEPENEPTAEREEDYFKSYDKISIHREMLQDTVRTFAYYDAILENKHYFKDKIVLDVGCGTGILSLLAAQAGAALVIGVDASEIIEMAQKVLADQDADVASRIIFVKSKVEDIAELPRGITHVDVIVSEWMGYCLLFESMLDSVIYARDRWLKKQGGLMFPDRASLYVAGMQDRQRRDDRQSWWYNAYGFNLSAMRKWADKTAIVEPVDVRKVVTEDCLVREFDLMSVKVEDLTFTAPIELVVEHDSEIQALVAFFTVDFTPCHKEAGFSTSMERPLTHWKQTVFYLVQNFMVRQGEKMSGEFSLRPNKWNKRKLEFQIILNHFGYNQTYYTNEHFFMY